MSRREDWEEQLVAVVMDSRDRPYEPGQWDCLLWPAAAVEALTGEDFGADHRGQYDSFASAYVYLNGLGFDSPAALLDSLFPEIPPAFAQRGDLVIAEDGIPAVCVGAVALSVGEDAAGLVAVPRVEWTKAWGVGR